MDGVQEIPLYLRSNYNVLQARGFFIIHMQNGRADLNRFAKGLLGIWSLQC